MLFALLSLSVISCKDEKIEPEPLTDTDTRITLHFYQNDSETRTEFETGLQWYCSYLGASLEKGSWARGTRWLDDQKIRIELSDLGFDQNALNRFAELIHLYEQTEEFKITGGIDAGRFIVSTLNNSNHYYKIVGMPSSLNEFNSNYRALSKQAGIVESAVSFGNRVINLPESSQNIEDLGYWAEELLGSLIDSSYTVEENEVMDIMPNGQLRFGIYNTNAELIVGSDARISRAGKPAKCLWCHEVNIQPAFAALTVIPGYYSPNEFDSIINVDRTSLDVYRAGLNSEIDFNKSFQHVEVEKIYIRFMEPSAKRLAEEWSMTVVEVESKLLGLPTHSHHEFPDFGSLYIREEIEEHAPYQVLPSTNTARETVSNEPDLLS